MRPAVPAAQAQTPSPVASWIDNASSMPSVTEKPRRSFGGARQIGEPVLPLQPVSFASSTPPALSLPSGRKNVRCTPIAALSSRARAREVMVLFLACATRVRIGNKVIEGIREVCHED